MMIKATITLALMYILQNQNILTTNQALVLFLGVVHFTQPGLNITLHHLYYFYCG